MNRQDTIDIHCHAAGIGAGGSGCFVSPRLRLNWRFKVYLRAYGISEKDLQAEGDEVVLRRISDLLCRSVFVGSAVVLAMDGVVDGEGRLDRSRTEFYVPNQFIADTVGRYDNLLFGASINPHRGDAIRRLEEAVRGKAVLLKWLPSIQEIDPSDARLKDFYHRMKELGLPLLTHTGTEKSFTSARDELAAPGRLRFPLECGVTVIAAHAAAGGSEGHRNIERLASLCGEFPNLYADISSLTQLNKLGSLGKVLSNVSFSGRLLYGTDMPLIATPAVSPLYFLPRLGLAKTIELLRIQNPWDRDVTLKKALGATDDLFIKAQKLLFRAGGGENDEA